METIGERIESRRVELGLNKKTIYLAANASSGMYPQWVSGSVPSYKKLMAIAEVLRVNVDWLETGKGKKELLSNVRQIRGNYGLSEDKINLPLLNVQASMGDGVTLNDEMVVDVITVYKDWMHKTLPSVSNITNISFIHAIGKSMSPTFEDGDILLVDTGDTSMTSDDVYVLEANDRLYIKRVRQRIDGMYEISSDNPAVKTVDVLNGDYDVTIKGRVVWVWNGRKV